MNRPHPLRKNPHAHATRVGEETVLLNGKTDNYYGLGGAAEIVWNQLQDGDTVESLLKRIDREYDLNERTEQYLLSAIEMLVMIGALSEDVEP